MTTTAGAVIVGGGVMGCSILYNLAERGVTDTVLLEKAALASGSTSRTQAILRMHYSNEVTARMAWDSLQVFENFEELVGTQSGYVRTGYFLVVGDEDRRSLEQNVAMLKGLGIETDVVSADEVRKMAPVLAVQEGEAFAYEHRSGYVDPYSVTTGYANRARDMGARVRLDAPVTRIEVSGGRVAAVVTAEERIATPIAVVAAGPWAGPMLRSLGVDVPLRTLRHQVVMLRRPEAIVPDHPTVGDVVNSFSARPDAGHLTLVGMGEEEFVGPDEYNQGVDMSMVESAMTGLARRMPGMARAWFRGGWSGLFTTTPDWHPILDRVEGIDGLYCAVGFSGHGFKLSPMIGVVMAELITQGRTTTIDVSMLGLGRFAAGQTLSSRYRMSVLA